MQRDHLLFRMGVHWRTALQLRQIRKLVDEGVVGGEQDGEITLMEYRRLEFERFLRIRNGLFREDQR